MQNPLSPPASECKVALRDPTITAVLELLAETFPACFSIYEQRRRPLKIGIHFDILAALDGAVAPKELSRALAVYAGNNSYRSSLVAGATRIDLNGQPAGVVTPKQVRLSRKAAPPVDTHAQAPRRLTLAGLREAARRRRERIASAALAPNPSPVEAGAQP